jgi:hypothetical protein
MAFGGAWSPEKVDLFRQGFDAFLDVLRIDSKDKGVCKLEPYLAQRMFLDKVFDGLSRDVHNFTNLKSRQLGMSTISWALDLFWLGTFEGLKGALIVHDDKTGVAARTTIGRYLKSITEDAPNFGFPGVKAHNRYILELENGSTLDYLVAGVKKAKTTGGLGRAQGRNFIHATELSSWVDREGIVSLRQSLSDEYPDRLYIWESTARGLNIFHDMCEEAKADPTQEFFFIGWWAKDNQRHRRGTALFEKYGVRPPTSEEQEKIDEVKRRYGVAIDQEQISWIRWKMDPTAQDEVSARDDQIKSATKELIQQEQPWTEDDAWIMTGSHFFPAKKLKEDIALAKTVPLKGYLYHIGRVFESIICEPTPRVHRANLKVWEDPVPGATYVVAADPAYGSSEFANQYVIEAVRCYADQIDQVAEFCVVQMDPRQFAWVIAHLCGAYNNARLLFELNGPGYAVLTAFRELEDKLREGYMRDTVQEGGIENIYWNVRQHISRRIETLKQTPDSFHWTTTPSNKVEVMEFMKGLYNNGILNVRSLDALDEMSRVVRDGKKVQGEGDTRDDRPMALALACHAWESGERKRLKALGRTREVERNQREPAPGEMQGVFAQMLTQGFLKQQAAIREAEARHYQRMVRGGRSNLTRW